MRPYPQTLNYTFSSSYSSEQTQTVNLPLNGGFKYLKIDYKWSLTAGSGAKPNTTLGFDAAISRLTLQQGGRSRIENTQGAQTTDSVAAMMTGGRYGDNLADLVYDPVVGQSVHDTDYRGYFYLPISSQASGSGLTLTIGLTPASMGGNWVDGTNLASWTCEISLAAVGSADGPDVSLVVIPTSSEVNSRVDMPQGRVVRTYIKDTSAYNLNTVLFPNGTVFTTPAQIEGEYNFITGTATSGTPDNKKYMYSYPIASRAGSVLEIRRASATNATVYFTVV